MESLREGRWVGIDIVRDSILEMDFEGWVRFKFVDIEMVVILGEENNIVFYFIV